MKKVKLMSLNLSEETLTPKIEILPLIDVVFLLLVFFIYAMVNMKTVNALKVDLPETSITDIKIEEPFFLSIDRDNKIYFGKKKIDLNDLGPLLKSSIITKTKPIVINGDKKSELGPVLEILEIIRNEGFKNVSFRRRKIQ
jgi:biopolymer transport protein ExbD